MHEYCISSSFLLLRQRALSPPHIGTFKSTRSSCFAALLKFFSHTYIHTYIFIAFLMLLMCFIMLSLVLCFLVIDAIENCYFYMLQLRFQIFFSFLFPFFVIFSLCYATSCRLCVVSLRQIKLLTSFLLHLVMTIIILLVHNMAHMY